MSEHVFEKLLREARGFVDQPPRKHTPYRADLLARIDAALAAADQQSADQPAACPACNGTRRIKVSSGVDVCPRCFPRAVDQQSVTVTESNYGLGPKCPHCGRYANSTEPQRE